MYRSMIFVVYNNCKVYIVFCSIYCTVVNGKLLYVEYIA